MNKKIVVIVIIVECILAVLLVSFFGKAIENFRKQTLVQDIYFTDENGVKIEDEQVLIVEITDSNSSVKLHYMIVSEKAAEKTVEFSSSHPSVLVDSTGVVTFLDRVSVEIIVRATDGSEKYDSIRLAIKQSDGGDVDI